MATPSQAGFYPAPTAGAYANARQYVRALYDVLSDAVSQQANIPAGLPAITARTNRFDVPSIPGLRFTVPTTPGEAAAIFARIRQVQNYQASFDAWMANVQQLPAGTPASAATNAPSLTDSRFSTVQAILTIHYVQPGLQQNVQYDTTNPMTLTPQMVRLLNELNPQAARDQVWVGLLNESIYWGNDIIVGISLERILSINFERRSNVVERSVFNQRLASLRTRLSPAPPPRRMRTRSQGPPGGRTRSGRRFTGNGASEASVIPVLAPNRRAANRMNYRPQDSSAPVPSSSLMPRMDLEDFRRNVMDSTEIYRSDYMRTMSREEKTNMCWFSAVCDLVNAAVGTEAINFDMLLNQLNYDRAQKGLCAHTMQSVREQGLSLEDMEPIFEHFEKCVLVFNVADELVYRREGMRHRKKRIKPFNWAFLVAHNHVYPLHDYDGRSHHKYQVARRGEEAFGNDRLLTREEFIDTASPMAYMFPYRLRLPTKDLKMTAPDVPEAKRIIHVLLRDTSLFQLLMKPHFHHKGRSVVVLVDRKDNLEQIYLEMVHEFNHRPEAYFMKDYIAQLSCTTHGFYEGLIFKRMGFLNTKNEPEMITHIDQYLLFERKAMEFRRIIYKTELLSFISTATFDLFEKFTRTPLIGPIPGADKSLLKDSCAVDFNRLYGYALQSLEKVPVLFPYSKFTIVRPHVREKFPPSSFVIGRVHGKRTAYLHQEYSLLYYPHLKEHIDNDPKRQIVYEHNPVFNYQYDTSFEILLYCEVTQLVPLNDTVTKYMRAFWDQPGICKSAKKMMFNSSIGMLGTKRNDLQTFYKGVIVESPDEMAMLGDNYTSENYNLRAMDDSNYVVLPSVQKCVNRYQSGMPFYQTIVDAAVLHVANYIDKMTAAGATPLQVQTDEIYFPTSQLELVEPFLYDGNSSDFDANGKLKLSKTSEFSVELPETIAQFQEDHESIVHAIVEIQTSQPRYADYEMLPVDANLQEHNRVLLTASVPGAGKTHRVATQEGVTGVIAVPTNALAVDLQTKFPQHHVVTIHRLLSKIGKAFGLLDSLQQKEPVHSPEEQEEEVVIPTKLFREGDSFLCLDEIYMLPTQVLLALYHFLKFLPASITHVYATGDPYQLDPVEDKRSTVNSSGAREAMIIRMFRKRIKLTECRRMHSPELNRRVEVFCGFLRNNRGLEVPHLRTRALTSLCQDHNVRIISEYHEVVEIMKAQPDMLVAAYTNETCTRITKHVLGSLENKLIPGTRLINRKRVYIKGGHRMHLNYIYEVKEVNPELDIALITELRADTMSDEEETSFWVDNKHILNHMHWHRTRTAHCLQGTSWNGGVVVCDVDRKHLVNRAFFYVTMTRARDFNRLFVYIPAGSGK